MDSEIESPAKPRNRRWLKGCGIGGVIALAVLGFWIGPVVRDLVNAGFLDRTEKRKYSGASIDNLKSMHMAMMIYHESEEMFPDGSGWMDAIEPRIQVYDMAKSESEKKLIAPQFRDQKGKYGYAMNSLCSRKYKDDLPDPATTVLIFESSETARNAHGDPAKIMAPSEKGQEPLAITIEGQLAKPKSGH